MNYNPRDPELLAWLADLSTEDAYMTRCALLSLFPSFYTKVGREFASHGVVRHKAEEYVSRENPEIHTNTIEAFFSVFKRGMKGVYQHCGKKHLHRYTADFDFRYNHRQALGFADTDRADKALLVVRGRRLMYRDSRWAS